MSRINDYLHVYCLVIAVIPTVIRYDLHSSHMLSSLIALSAIGNIIAIRIVWTQMRHLSMPFNISYSAACPTIRSNLTKRSERARLISVSGSAGGVVGRRVATLRLIILQRVQVQGREAILYQVGRKVGTSVFLAWIWLLDLYVCPELKKKICTITIIS